MEMVEEKIVERIDVNFLNVFIQKLVEMLKQMFERKVINFLKKIFGKLIIKEYFIVSVYVGYFCFFINDFVFKWFIKFDIIFVDYFNICVFQRYKGSIVNFYIYVKVIVEEFCGFVVECGVFIVFVM